MQKNLKALPYLLVNVILFYLFPLMIRDTGSAIVIMLGIIPVISFITSIFYGMKHSFNFLYSLMVALLFAPSIFIFYNSTAWIYIVIYFLLSLVGNSIGKILHGPIE